MFFQNIVDTIFNVYWKIYKAQIPEPFGCMDCGEKFFKHLTLLGKILYVFRPLMTRRKQRKMIQPMLVSSKIRKQSLEIDHTKTSIYFSLIAHSLHQVFVKDVVHVGTNITPDQTTQYIDGTTITTFPIDQPPVELWSSGQPIAYLWTFDRCCFPDFNQITWPAEIERILTVQNAGGSSEISELLSMYYMSLKFGATGFIPEMEVNYQFQSSICDYLMTINHQTVGVSVTRGLSYPFNRPISIEFATSLIHKKMIGINIAKRTVSAIHQFELSVIHIWCQSWDDAVIIRDTYMSIIDDDIYGLYGHTYVICSICQSECIYTNMVTPESCSAQ